MADQEDGTPAAERTQAPDLQTATGQPGGGGSSVGLMDALQSMRGSIPNEAILGLLQGPSFGQRMGQAAAGGVAFMRGQPNPANAIIEQQQKQQLGIAQIMEKMNEQQRLSLQWGVTNDRLQRAENRLEKHTQFEEADKMAQRALEKQKLQMGAYDNFLASATNPETKAALAKMKAGVMEQVMGVPVPQNVIEGWALPTPITQERNKQIATAFNSAGADPAKQQLAAQQFRLDPQSAQFYATMVKSDAFLAANGIESSDVLYGKQIDREVKEADLLDKLTPRELKGDQKFAIALKGVSQKLFPDREYADLTTPEQARVGDAVHNQLKVEEEQKLRLQNQLQTDRLLAGIDARLAGKAAAPTNPLVVQKMVAPFQKSDQLLDSIAIIREKMKGIPDDALPSSDTLAAQKWAQIKRSTVYRGNEALFQFQQLWAPVTIGQIDRGFFDDKGVRIAAAFGKQLEVTDSLPTRATMNKYLDTLEGMVAQKSLKDLTVLQRTPGTPPEVLEGVKGIMAPRMPRLPDTPLNTAPALKVRKQYMDMRKGSKTYGQAVWATMSAGDPIPPGMVEIK